jgi:hypothetical protein
LLLSETVAEFILDAVRARVPRTWRQGARSPALPCEHAAPALRSFAEYRVRGVCEDAVRGLMLIGAGFPIALRESPFSAREVLGLQARGSRCVSLLPASAIVPPPHDDALGFALHDLCHVAKLGDPRFFVEQIGFFVSVERALADERWSAIERMLDDEWRRDRDAVVADMNGSSVFLFAALKMKLKMAARRMLARERGAAAPCGGALSAEESARFDALCAVLFDALDFRGAIRASAAMTSARRDCPVAARQIAEHFRELGRCQLRVACQPERGGEISRASC